MKKFILSLILSLCSFLISHCLVAQIIHIPADRTTIQEGINVAGAGDTVLVAEGTYVENISFKGKAITVASYFLMDGDTSHISKTIIDGSEPEDPEKGSVVTFNFYEDTNSILCGFTITGGKGTYYPVDNSLSGGGIVLIDAGATLKNNYIQWNSLSGDYLVSGAGICIWPSTMQQKTKIIGNKIRYNSLISKKEYISGGGMDIYCDVELIDNEIAFNYCQSTKVTATGEPPVGGGVTINACFNPVVITIFNNWIHDNYVMSTCDILFGANGGGLLVRDECEGIISDNRIEYNRVEALNNSRGAGIFMAFVDTSLLLENNIITHNFSPTENCNGAGIYIFEGKVNIVNNLIHDNQALYGGAGYVTGNLNDVPVAFVNNTIVGNQASDEGGGLVFDNAEAIILNSILWGNEANDGNQIFSQGSNLTVSYSDIEGGWEGDGNIDEYPYFLDDDTLFHIDQYSPCANSGIDSLDILGLWYYAPEVDFEGDERPYGGGIVDRGADECSIYIKVDDPLVKSEELRVKSYPNPFREKSTIELYLPEDQQVLLKLFDLAGREVRTLAFGRLRQGEHRYVLSSGDLENGIYLMTISTLQSTVTKKLVIHKF